MRSPANSGGSEAGNSIFQKICARRRLECAGEIDQVGIDGADRGQHVDHHREEHDQDRDQDFRIDGEAHPQDEQRRECHLGRDLQRQNIGRQRELGGGRHADQVADEGAEQAAEDEAHQHLRRRDAGVEGQPDHMPHPHCFFRHHRQRRDDEWRNAQQPRAPLPRGEEHDQQGEACGRAPPHDRGIRGIAHAGTASGCADVEAVHQSVHVVCRPSDGCGA